MTLSRIADFVRPSRRGQRSLTIRLKLTLWYGALFFLAGVLLITVNFFMVRSSLTSVPEEARRVVAQRLNIPEEMLEQGGSGQHITINGIPLPMVLNEVQKELKDEALRQLVIRSLLALAIMTSITFVLSWLLAERMLRPLHAITSTARRLSESTLHERIGLQGPRDELRELADTFDAMLARLDTAFTAQKEFVANASHELRTPLTIIRTEMDVALSDPDISRQDLEEMGAAVTDAVNRSDKLINGLLVLARADGSLTMADTDLADLARDQIGLLSQQADEMGLRLQMDLQPARLMGDRVLLERMIGNLIDNAVGHNDPDGWFSVRTGVENGEAVLQVSNSGHSVDADEIDKLFDRFYRPDKSRSRKTGGFGLGLSIVKSVVVAHGGSVVIVPLSEGGLDVNVRLPLQTPETPRVTSATE